MKPVRIFTAFLIVLVCTVNILSAQKKPSWVDNRPVNPAFYIGIGYAQQDPSLGDYRKIAKDEALRDLASEITVNISSEFIHTIVEQSGMVEEDVRKQVRSSTEASLEGYELVDNYESDSEYWVYYRMDKDDYAAAKKAKLDRAKGLALDLYGKAKQSEKSGDYANALIFYVQALNPIQDYLSDPLNVTYEGARIYLMNAIYTSVQSLLANIELTNDSGKLEGKVGQSLKKPLAVSAKYNMGGTPVPVKNLPLKFDFIRGGGKILSKLNTDGMGAVRCPISKITAVDKMQMVKAEVDLNSAMGSSPSPLVKGIVNNFTTPSVKFILTVTGLTAYMEVSEVHISGGQSILYIEPKLKNALTNYGFTFTNDPAAADVMITLEAKARKGSEMHGLFVSWVDMNLAIMDMSSGEEVFKDSFPNIKGINLDYDKAAVKAFEEAAKKVKEVLPGVIKKFQK